jgi:penicillin G amidase
MRVLRRPGILIASAALGIGAAVGVAACGEERGGDVQFEDGTGTETGGTGTETGATGTETGATGTETGATGTETTETSP